MRLVVLSMVAVLVPALFTGCGGGDEGTSADVALLKGQPLLLVSGVDLPQDVTRAQPSATFENETVSGSTGCNRYTAPYTIDGYSLEIGATTMTRMACAPPGDAVEQAYLAALGQVTAWRADGDAVVLTDGDETELQYERATPAGTWQVTGLRGDDAVSSPIAGTELTATFGDDGALSGSSGCNTYTAVYTIDKGEIQIADVAGTKKACAEPAGVMEQESSYLALLPTAAAFRVDGGVLALMNVDREVLVSFTRAP